MQQDNQLVRQFNAGLQEMRELFHESGRLEDSNAKLDEITKLLCLEIASVRDPKIKVPSLKELLNKYTEKGIVPALNEALILASKSLILTNYDGESLLGPNPKFNIAESEENLARALASIVLNSFNGYLRGNHTAETFEFLNEAFGHFIRDNFRQNIEDAQYMTPPEAVNYMAELGASYFKEKKLKQSEQLIICDPSCGVGSFLAQFYRVWCMGEKESANLVLIGQDKVDRMARLSLLNLALFGIKDAKVYRGNSLLTGSPLDSYHEKCDLILTNPPFGARFSCLDLSKNNHNFFPLLCSYIQNKTGEIDSELLFLDRYISLLKPGGLLVAVLPDSVISSGGLSQHLRKKIEEKLTIRSITELPAVTFAQAGTRTKTCILELEKTSPQNNIIFISKASSLGYEVASKKGVPYKKIEGKNDLEILSNIISDANTSRKTFSNFELIFNEPSCVAVSQKTISKETWTPSHYSSSRLSTLKTLEKLASSENFEVFQLKDIVSIPKRKNQEILDKKEQKCISVLHIGAFGTVNIKDFMEYEPKTPGKSCKQGDILFSKINPRIPRAIVVPKLPFELTCSSEFEIMQPKSGYSSHEIMLLLLSDYAQNQIQSLTSGTSSSHNRIKTNELMSVRLIIPKKDSLMREKYENAVKSFSEANIKIHEANIILQKEWGLINSLSAT